MRPYSTDLRERILTTIQRGEYSLREITDLFSVSLSFLVRLLQRHRRTDSVQPKPHGGGSKPLLSDQDLVRLQQLVRQQPDATLAELRERLGIPCSLATLSRALKRLRITRKKKTLHAQERDKPEVQAQRATFDQKMASVDPEHLVFVDESGATTAMTRTHGRAPAGERVKQSAPGKWTGMTLIAGMRATEVVAPFVFCGATDTAAFQTYVEKVLVPEVHPGDVVVWDNLKPHLNAEVQAAVEAAGARVERLPPWSPDKNPIEEMFAKVKEHLRSIGGRTVMNDNYTSRPATTRIPDPLRRFALFSDN